VVDQPDGILAGLRGRERGERRRHEHDDEPEP
jgi:hypothetical protein